MSFHTLRFNRSASSYESHADVQTRMADRLLDLWSGPVPQKILEFGCGTGILTRRLQKRFPESLLLATDAAPAMLEEARKRCTENGGGGLQFVLQDAQGLSDFREHAISVSPFDLVASNALVQWFPDLEKHLEFAWRLVKPGGAYLLSGFSLSNFSELNSLLAEPPFSYRNFPGHDPKSVETAATNSGWKVIEMREWEEKEILPSALDVLHRLQVLGSTRDPREGGRLNRKSLSYLISEYTRRFGETDGVRLTWKPWIALLKR